MDYEIELKALQLQHLAVVRFHASEAEMAQQMGAAFGAVIEYLTRNGLQPQGPAVAVYTEPFGTVFDVAAGFVVAAPITGDGHVVPDELPAGEAAVTMHVGPYEGLSDAYQAVQAWIEREAREPAGKTWEEYLDGPETPPEQTRTVLYRPLKPR